jgi:hypothetical protein
MADLEISTPIRTYKFKVEQTAMDRRIKYKGKHYMISKARIGVCNLCRAVKGVDCRQTQWHHIEYDDKHKERYSIELCASCHRKETIVSQGIERIKEIASLGGCKTPLTQLSEMGKKSMTRRIAILGKEEHLRRADNARKMVYNRWTGKLVKRRTFTNV